DPVPAPIPIAFDPSTFLDDAQDELPADEPVLAPDADATPPAPDGLGDDRAVLTDAELEELSERGIAGPLAGMSLDDLQLDDVSIDDPVLSPDAAVTMPAGALGDPDPFQPDFPTEYVAPVDYTLDADTSAIELDDGVEPIDMDPVVDVDVDPVPIDGPVEPIILPEPYPEEPIQPQDEPIDMEPAVEYDPIGPDPAVDPGP
ncbi:MAG TPA: hypothetical protein VEO00_08130, partial [Actinomycetota bacterium]|nr:hypothetical protein [Actinomycetota bacterium]